MVTILPVYINFNTDKKSQSQYICQILHFSAVLYTSERKTDFRLDYWYFLFPKMYLINNFTFTFNLVLICIAYSFLKTFLSLAILFTSLIMYGLVINSTFTFNIVYSLQISLVYFFQQTYPTFTYQLDMQTIVYIYQFYFHFQSCIFLNNYGNNNYILYMYIHTV